MSLVISTVHLDAIRAEARAAAPRECCGLLMGDPAAGTVSDIVPAANVAADPRHRFEIDPATLLRAHRAARDGGPAIMGHYHSHPAGEAVPSAVDAAMAEGRGEYWLLIGADGSAGVWRAGPTGQLHGRFEPLLLTVSPHPALARPGPDRHEGAAPDPIDFASLLCSRLCHDLLSPVGALNNGIELLADETDPSMRDQCMDLLGDSARTTAGKLKFFRLAFGAAGGYGEAIPTHEIRGAIEGMFPAGGKLDLSWMISGDALPKPAAKLLLNLVLMTGEALPRGGTMTIGAEQNGKGTEIVVRGEGARLTFDPVIRAALSHGEEDVTTRTAAAYLIRTLAAQNGGQLLVSAPEDPFLMFGASLPHG